MNQHQETDSKTLWQRLVDTELAYLTAWRDFLAEEVDRIPLLREALNNRDRLTAVKVVPYLKVPERLQLFGALVYAASAAHGPVGAVREIIRLLPRDWVLAHIEEETEPILRNEEYDDYWMFLELYGELDANLALKLARRAAAHTDPEIRELGQDHLERLGHKDGSAGSTSTLPSLPLGTTDAKTTST